MVMFFSTSDPVKASDQSPSSIMNISFMAEDLKRLGCDNKINLDQTLSMSFAYPLF